MENIVAALKDTPIPTILVIAGIVFLLLSIAGQLAGRIAVPPERQRQAAIIGALLVVVGVAIHVVPPRLIPPEPQGVPALTPSKPTQKEDQPPQTSTPLPSSQPAPSTPGSTPQPSNVEEVQIPLLNARLTALRFFEGDSCDLLPPERRAYRQRFAKVITRDIYTEITLEYPKREQRLDFTIQAVYQYKAPEGGKVVNSPELSTYLPADSQKSLHTFRSDEGRVCCSFPCIGLSERRRLGGWSAGSYTVDVYINGEKVTNNSFEIHE
jgi:hypothetical protein